MPSDRNARSSVFWSEDPRTPDFMLRALAPSFCIGGLVEESYAEPVLMPVGLCVVSFPVLRVSWEPYTVRRVLVSIDLYLNKYPVLTGLIVLVFSR